MPKIIITGYPYSFPYYFKVFEYVKNKDDFVFVLPSLWQAKEGKIKIKLAKRPDFKIYGLKTVSWGGKSLFAALFKGWMPGLLLLLPYFRIKFHSRVLYSCSEPNLLTTLYNGFLAKVFGFKHVIFTWQNVEPEARMTGIKLALSNFLVRLNLVLTDGVICGNKKAEEIINKLKPKDSKLKTIVCPLSGVDVDRFHPGTAKDKTILFYGVLEERKGVEFLIQAFSKISVEDATLMIIGTGPEKEKLENLVGELGIKTRVSFRDWMPNEALPEILRNSAVFVYPSIPWGGWEEQFGYAMAEAGASGVPVVATKTGSINEVVKNGETGILVDSGHVEQLRNALEKLLADEPLREKMGLAGRDFVVNNFSHLVVADKIFHFLNQFI
ncbi:MAG: glycosyl transferase family protein [Parcubacteria group bacterium Gr01-1014_44]|nr:MAG: glycosyl transferase family protein [Parcubacteria group bacterium Gr01-1014_44]